MKKTFCSKLYNNRALSILCVFILTFCACKKDHSDVPDNKQKPVTTENIEVSDKVINMDKFPTVKLVSTLTDLKNGLYTYQITGTKNPDFKIGSVMLVN